MFILGIFCGAFLGGIGIYGWLMWYFRKGFFR